MAMSSRTALPPLQNLQAFVAAADAGSFTKAAGAMHLTQGAVSRQVMALEAHFGCALFTRQPRGLALTPEGALLLAAVREALAGVRLASEAIRRQAAVINLQVPPTLAARWLLPRLPHLRQALPNLDLRISTNWTDAPDFARSSVDAIIAHGHGRWPHIDKVLLMRERLTPMCSRSKAACLKTPADLAKVELLHPGPERREWRRWLEGGSVKGVDGDSGHVFDTLDLALSAATRGQGVAIADPQMLQELLADGVLVTPFRTQVTSGNSYFLTWPPANGSKRGLGELRTWLLKEFSTPR